MKYSKGKLDNIFLYDTKVENIFLNEYMVGAKGEYVKVYLLGLMLAEAGAEVEKHILANQLGMKESEVEKAWKYWQDKGLVKIEENEISFVSIREKMFGTGSSEEEENFSPKEGAKEIFAAIESKWGTLYSGKELEEIADWPDFYNITPEAIVRGIEYCAEIKKENLKYLEKVIQGWSTSGLKTLEDVQSYLDENDQKYYRYKRVMQALGFKRNATEAEKALIDTWFGEMNFTMERVLDACAQTTGISNPNLKYVSSILSSWYKEATEKGIDVNKETVSQAVLNSYYNFLREEAERKAKERKEEVYNAIPRIKEIDAQVNSLGSKMTTALIAGNSLEMSQFEKMMDDLLQERAITLTENNYEMDYTDVKYSCDICKDTGLTDEGEKCECRKLRIEEARLWQEERK